MAAEINARYDRGYATNDLNDAGVLIHTFDDHLDSNEPWHTKQTGWMEDYSNILSCSIVNRRKHGIFSGPTGNGGGVVLSPLSKTLCSYPYDGGAMNYAWGCGPTMCSEPSNIWGCAFPPSMLYRMMQIHFNGDQWKYNEVVVDQFNMSITAVWGGWGARQVHAKLLEHFGLNENQLPFLEGGKHPFG